MAAGREWSRGCGYNHDGCTAFAQVEACKRGDCKHNTDLECHAPAIVVGQSGDTADCLTYEHQ